MNAPTSAVGRAAVQMCAARGVPVVCALRARETDDAWERDARYLKSLGASLVVRDAAGGFRTRAAADALGEMPPVALALNGDVCASSAALAGALAESGGMVTYGGMARAPAHAPWRCDFQKRHRDGFCSPVERGGADVAKKKHGKTIRRRARAAGARARGCSRVVWDGRPRGDGDAHARGGVLRVPNALLAGGKVGEGKMALWTSTS